MVGYYTGSKRVPFIEKFEISYSQSSGTDDSHFEKDYRLFVWTKGFLSGYISIDPPGLLGEPLQERRTVADFTLGLGERLALLEGQDSGELVVILDAEVEPLAEEH